MLLAFQADISRVFTFMVAHEGSGRSYANIGIPEPHHPVSHHGDTPEGIAKYVKLTFFRGTSLRPVPPGPSKQKEVRYLDIHEDDPLDEKQLASWIRQAASIPGWDGGSPGNGGIPL